MKTVVEIVARPGPGGRTVLPVVRASGQLAVRRTGPATVHLVATAFGPPAPGCKLGSVSDAAAAGGSVDDGSGCTSPFPRSCVKPMISPTPIVAQRMHAPTMRRFFPSGDSKLNTSRMAVALPACSK
jgi:hypothetical protein